MKKIIQKLGVITVMGLFCASPLIIIIAYFTYTEKIVAPVLIILVIIGLYCALTIEED